MYIYIYIYIYIYNHKKISLTILIHLRVVNLACLRQRFDDWLFQVSFYLYNFFYYLQYILSKFMHITLYNCR